MGQTIAGNRYAVVVMTTVRRPRVGAMWIAIGALAIGAIGALVSHGHVWPVQWWVIGPIIAAIRARPKIENTNVLASSDGLRVGGKLYPRAKLTSALLRHEGSRTWVALRGKGLMESSSVDVEVANDEKADELCAALGLDAKSTTAEFAMFHSPPAIRNALVVFTGMMIAAAAIGIAAQQALMPLFAFAAFAGVFALGLPLLYLARRARLLVGADGIVFKRGFEKREFVSHAEIADVSANGAEVVVARKHGKPLTLSVGGERARRTRDRSEHELQAQSVVWRIQKAREAFAALAGDVPQAALVLDRAGKTAREWLDELRRAGAGANATFRGAMLSREQLLRVVESTTAAARERLAAAVALHEGMTTEEKPRIRVAAELCAEPALRERMVRVVDAPSDDELIAALEESESLSASA